MKETGFQDKDLKEEKFPHSKKVSHRRGQGSFRTTEGSKRTGGRSEGTAEGIHHRDRGQQHATAKKRLGCLSPQQRCGQGIMARVRLLDLRERTWAGFHAGSLGEPG